MRSYLKYRDLTMKVMKRQIRAQPMWPEWFGERSAFPQSLPPHRARPNRMRYW